MVGLSYGSVAQQATLANRLLTGHLGQPESGLGEAQALAHIEHPGGRGTHDAVAVLQRIYDFKQRVTHLDTGADRLQEADHTGMRRIGVFGAGKRRGCAGWRRRGGPIAFAR